MRDEEKAKDMLRSLSGRKHTVVTSICAINPKTKQEERSSTTSYVEFESLSEEMIRKCKEKASAAGYEIELKSCDFRNLSCWEGKQFDCVASTGNSLPHVNNDDVLTALEQMNSLVKKGGYLYLDTRNWEKF